MDQKSSKVERKELPQKEFYEKLDEESKEYEANKELHDMEQRPDLLAHEHTFDVGIGNTAVCNCGWGLYLDVEDSIRGGHIFRNGTLII